MAGGNDDFDQVLKADPVPRGEGMARGVDREEGATGRHDVRRAARWCTAGTGGRNGRPGRSPVGCSVNATITSMRRRRDEDDRGQHEQGGDLESPGP